MCAKRAGLCSGCFYRGFARPEKKRAFAGCSWIMAVGTCSCPVISFIGPREEEIKRRTPKVDGRTRIREWIVSAVVFADMLQFPCGP